MTQVHSIAEACAIARAGRTALYQAISSGALVAHKRGRRSLIFSSDLQRWIESLPQIELKHPRQCEAVLGTASSKGSDRKDSDACAGESGANASSGGAV
jgi:excisionase family DNA binding protein